MDLNDRFACTDSTCQTCGAATGDKVLHNEWHNEQERAQATQPREIPEYLGYAGQFDAQLSAPNDPARRATMKPLVTAKMLDEAKYANDESPAAPLNLMADRLNAALKPLLAEWEAAIVEACAQIIDQEIRWRETERDDSGFKLAAGYMRPLDELAKAIRSLSAPDALARHDAAVRLAEGKHELVELARRMEMDAPGKLWGYGAILEYCKERIAAIEGKP